MSTVDKAILAIDRWLSASGMAESRLGLFACANPRAIQRLREKTATLKTLEAVLDYIERTPAKVTI